MVIDILRQEHRNIEMLLLVLERELSVFARGERPDYEVIHAVIAYFQVYPDAYHSFDAASGVETPHSAYGHLLAYNPAAIVDLTSECPSS